ncbi:BFP_1a_G0030920.mRNA.1.CDS.1 [Saccharomyces cerevisiae]|nr:BFP_1a_G0030920.mRNA.1.CDS.1 [Saccharomyces cerevisiae]CAI7190316.1 BFP_1a_G0030920.mRNA.1.CDS.1 [Saccharomyces cerevisiae]
MQLGCEGVFVGSGIFKSSDPEKLACAIVEATTHYDNPAKLLQVSSDLGDLMGGISIQSINEAGGKKTVQDFLKSDGRTSDAHTTLIFFPSKGQSAIVVSIYYVAQHGNHIQPVCIYEN